MHVWYANATLINLILKIFVFLLYVIMHPILLLLINFKGLWKIGCYMNGGVDAVRQSTSMEAQMRTLWHPTVKKARQSTTKEARQLIVKEARQLTAKAAHMRSTSQRRRRRICGSTFDGEGGVDVVWCSSGIETKEWARTREGEGTELWGESKSLIKI